LGDPVASIHPTAQVDGVAGPDVVIGPYCVVGPGVVLSAGVRLHENVILKGDTEIGEGTEIFPFASIGQPAQIFGYAGRPGRLKIGARCVIREYVTINVGSERGDLVTEVGNDCYFMMASHVGHDCRIGHNVVLVGYSGVSGHCVVGDHAIIAGHAGLHQFVRVGESAYIAGLSAVVSDVIPYGMAFGNRARLRGLNVVGLKRRGIEKSRIHNLWAAYRDLFADVGTFRERMDKVIVDYGQEPLVRNIVEFIRDGGERAICGPNDEE
jgi:UDP-N-acetylglucosamine acyltransferase